MAQRLTVENLLKSVGMTTEEVESWCHEGASPPGVDGSGCELGQPLLPPPQEATHLVLCVCLKPPSQAAAPSESPETLSEMVGLGEGEAPAEPALPGSAGASPSQAGASPSSNTAFGTASEAEIPESKWQDLESRWNAILGLEASIDVLRISMESMRAELEASSRRTLNTEEKVHALNADVAQWNKAKSRIVYALPKLREFIHRATWAAGTPERKKLEELYENHIHPRIPFPQMDRVADQLENLLKDRQILSAHGMTVQQECTSISADVQNTLSMLRSNAASNAIRKRGATIQRSKRL
jgi:hypothetical protein